jgi:hypothetical protein
VDEEAGDGDEGLVRGATAFVADGQTFVCVQPGDGALDHPAEAAQAGAVRGGAVRDAVADAATAQEPPVFVVVIATVGVEQIGSQARPAYAAAEVTPAPKIGGDSEPVG